MKIFSPLFKILSFRASANAESFSSDEISNETSDETSDETAVIGGLCSDRLFFDPSETSSILEHALSYGDGVGIVAMDSNDPFLDFRASMAEMVEAHGLKSWEWLEELLACYLGVNQKSNHGYIIRAFVDLLDHVCLPAAECSPS